MGSRPSTTNATMPSLVTELGCGARLVGLDESVTLKQTMPVRAAHEPAQTYGRGTCCLGEVTEL